MSKMKRYKFCNSSVSKLAYTCPVCGGKIHKPFYKRGWFIVILVITAISISILIKINIKETIKTMGNIIGDDFKENYNIGENIIFNNKILCVSSAEKSNGNKYDKPREGYEYIIVTISFQNKSDEIISYNTFDFSMENSSGQISDEVFTVIDKDTNIQYGKLDTNGSVKGTIIFEEPINDSNLVLRYKSDIFDNKEVKININKFK